MIPPKECSGCGACVDLCPAGAIRFEKDDEGFWYPRVDTASCVNCGKCEKICPVMTERQEETQQPQAYAAQSTNTRILETSSSGGVFSVLAGYVLKHGGVVFGCAMTDDCYAAEHKKVERTEELEELRGSKYLQSRTDHIFPSVKAALEHDRYVLFSGTPCQVAGLRSYLTGTNTENLITVDIVCHGAPSPFVWEKFVKHWEKIKASKIVSVQFRNKSRGWKTYSLVLTFENGQVYSNLAAKDLYCRGFIGDYFLRRSCYCCKAKGSGHVSDITLGDLWGARQVCPQMDDDRGTSLVLVNTEKGARVFREISGYLESHPIDVREALQYNPSYYVSSSRLAYRAYFMKLLNRKNIIKALEACTGTAYVYRVRRKMIAWASRLKKK